MAISTKIVDDKMVIKLGERLDFLNEEEVNSAIVKAMGKRNIDIVLDFSSLDYLSGAGIKLLLKARNLIKKANGSLVLMEMAANVKEMLEVIGLKEGFVFADNLDEACRSNEKYSRNNNTTEVPKPIVRPVVERPATTQQYTPKKPVVEKQPEAYVSPKPSKPAKPKPSPESKPKAAGKKVYMMKGDSCDYWDFGGNFTFYKGKVCANCTYFKGKWYSKIGECTKEN